MRTLALALAAAALWTAAGGCTKARTETVIVVQTAGVRIPEDVASVRLVIADRAPGGDDVLLNDAVPLCHAGLTSGCYTLPLSAALYPGPKHGTDDSVRVEIDALDGNGRTAIADAAVFTFAAGQSQRLDFVLYANCIGVTDCAKRDQACGPDATCIGLSTTQLGSSPDLGNVGSGPVDMSRAPVDMAGAAPVDMASSIDMAGCVPGQCAGRTVCELGLCVACGGDTQPCCDTGLSCDAPLTCQAGTCAPVVTGPDMATIPPSDMATIPPSDASMTSNDMMISMDAF